jgi:tetratricopeptide (TPR) repeat protein
MRLSKYEQALACCEEVIRLEPGSLNGWHNRGNVLLCLYRYGDALASFERALQIAPGDAEVWNGRGNALKDMNQVDKALECFDKALVLNPNYAKGWFSKGCTLAGRAGGDRQALQCFELAQRLGHPMADAKIAELRQKLKG